MQKLGKAPPPSTNSAVPQCASPAQVPHTGDITWPHLNDHWPNLFAFGTFLAKVADTEEPPAELLTKILSLVPSAQDGALLCVGQDATDEGGRLGAQVSLFDVRDPANPLRLSTAALGSYGTPVEWDHHAFLYWPETAQLVLPVDPNWCAGIILEDAGLEAAD